MRVIRGVIVVLAFALIGAVLAAVITSRADSGDGSYLVRAVFDNSSFVIPGEDVKVAGVKVGTIQAVGLTSNNKAAITLEIDDPRFEPFRADAHCEIGLESLLGEQFVQCTPSQPVAAGAQRAPVLPSIASGPDKGQHLLGVQNTTTPVGLDQFADITRLPQQQRLQLIISGLGAGPCRQRTGAQRGAAARRSGAAADRPGDRRAVEPEPGAGPTDQRIRPDPQAARGAARARRRIHQARGHGRGSGSRAGRRDRGQPAGVPAVPAPAQARGGTPDKAVAPDRLGATAARRPGPVDQRFAARPRPACDERDPRRENAGQRRAARGVHVPAHQRGRPAAAQLSPSRCSRWPRTSRRCRAASTTPAASRT